MKINVGKISLLSSGVFTQYTECAAWTYYVECHNQTVDLFIDDYWAFCAFDGICKRNTLPRNESKNGQPMKAFLQIQKFGGIGNWLCDDTLKVEITNPEYSIQRVGTYSDGKPMLALVKNS